MKKTIKNALIATLSFAFVGAASVATVLASADEINSLNDVTLEMLEGGSIRVNDGEVTGIRFSAALDDAELAWLNANYDEVKFGTFIMPADYGTFSNASLFGETAEYYWEGGEEAKAGQKEILQMYGAIYEYTDKAGNTYNRVNGSITKVNEVNFNRTFVGVCYMELTKGEEVTYKLATANDNERNVLYIAQRALESEGWEVTDEKYVNTLGFIESYKSENPTATVKYTVNKHLATKSGGFTVETEERTAEFDADISLTAEAEKVDFYALDTANSSMTGKAYAQDKLTLDLYYGFKLEDNGINLMGASESSFYAIEYFEDADKYVMPAQGNYVGVVITSDYIANALNNGIAKLAVTFGNNEGEGFGFGRTEGPAGATNITNGYEITLDKTADYSAGLRIRFYQHDGVGPSCKSVWMTIGQVSVAENAVGFFRNPETVEYQGDNVWLVTKANQSVGFVFSKDYVESLIAKGAKGMVVTFENAENDGRVFDGYYMTTSAGVMSAKNTASDISSFNKSTGEWTVNFAKFIDGTAQWHCDIDGSNGGASFSNAQEFDGVSIYFYMFKDAGVTNCKKVKITVTPTF